VTGEYPSRSVFAAGKKGHDLMRLLKAATQRCYTPGDLARVSTAQDDLHYLCNDAKLRRMVRILSDFGLAARYYNLNVVLNEANPGPSPDHWPRCLSVTGSRHLERARSACSRD